MYIKHIYFFHTSQLNEGGEGGLTETEICPIFKRLAEKLPKKLADSGNGEVTETEIGPIF